MRRSSVLRLYKADASPLEPPKNERSATYSFPKIKNRNSLGLSLSKSGISCILRLIAIIALSIATMATANPVDPAAVELEQRGNSGCRLL